ncbi:hypothetical protein N657DRAFT_634463 [Parathielavia appendiculata]|uniref:Hyaluronan/mRNA-binding protein domain-containing protein n=1 Tax=Parathielavia appendiculata TaxID=2587402 RepID=A0AAN6TYU9_9PEZI|nr:hypothetical protein N657DRAFT_634463 [Parathielavia appendiculata]
MVSHQNIFNILGDEAEGDEIRPPVKTVEKPATNTVKRNTDGLAPSKGPTQGGNRRGGANVSGNEAAFRDRNAGRESNRGKSTDEAPRGRRGGFRGGRGGRREEGDRHPTRSAPHSNSEKQAAQSWGANEGEAELKDEEAGAKIAQSEQKAEGEAAAEATTEGETKEEEPEEKTKTYDQYLAELAEKKLGLEAEKEIRKPNEGVKDDKWKDFAPLSKKPEEEELFAGSGGKAKRERTRKEKQTIPIVPTYVAPEAERTRGGRGGRGGARGEGGRGRGAPRGEFRGGRGAPRGEFRGGRGGRAQESKPLDPNDESAFPSLGGN